MKTKKWAPALAAALFALWSVMVMVSHVRAQNAPQANTTPVQQAVSLYYVIPISATAAVNTQTTLTIPAPAAGLYNYVCKLQANVSNDTTGTAVTNVVSTSTNFNSFAIKVSEAATASANYDSPVYDFGSPSTGCAKSTSPGTATTFVSPSGVTHAMWTWTAAYYQAP